MPITRAASKNLFQTQWLSKQVFNNRSHYTLNFNDRLLTIFNNDQEFFIETLAEIINNDLNSASYIVFKINPSSPDLFLKFMAYLKNNRSYSNGPALLELIFQNIIACEVHIAAEFPINFSANGALLVNPELIEHLQRTNEVFHIVLQQIEHALKACPLLKELKLHFCNQFILSLQRAHRVIQPTPLQSEEEAAFTAQQIFSDLLKNIPAQAISFLYHLEVTIKKLDGLYLKFNNFSFKGKFDYLSREPTQDVPVVLRASYPDHLTRALSPAKNLQFFSLKYLPKDPHGGGGDLSVAHIASLFNKWRQERDESYELLSQVKIEIPVYEHDWGFYSALLTDWKLNSLSLNLKSRLQPQKQAAFFKKPSELSQLMRFGLNIQKNKTLEAFTFVTDMPHPHETPKEFISFVRAIARNLVLKKLNLSVPNTLGLKNYPWQLRVLNEFRRHPTLNSIKLFGSGPEILESPCLGVTPLERGLYQIHYEIQEYLQSKTHLLEKADRLNQFYRYLSHYTQPNLLESEYQSACNMLAKASFYELILMANLYYRNAARESVSKAAFFKQQELWYFFSKMTKTKSNPIRLKDCFQAIIGYLSEKDLAEIFILSGGLFHQLKKMLVLQCSAPEEQATESVAKPLLFSNMNCPRAITLDDRSLKQKNFSKKTTREL